MNEEILKNIEDPVEDLKKAIIKEKDLDSFEKKFVTNVYESIAPHFR
jgi:hypothetical protein